MLRALRTACTDRDAFDGLCGNCHAGAVCNRTACRCRQAIAGERAPEHARAAHTCFASGRHCGLAVCCDQTKFDLRYHVSADRALTWRSADLDSLSRRQFAPCMLGGKACEEENAENPARPVSHSGDGWTIQ